MPNSPGGSREKRRTRIDILFGAIFLVAAGRFLVKGLLEGAPLGTTVVDSRFWLVTAVAALFLFSRKQPRLRILQPFVFLLCALIPFSQSTETVFGFGFFAVGALMLFFDGHLHKKPLPKILGLGGYFLGLIVLSAVASTATVEQIFALFLFVAAFFLYLFLIFQERIIVFVTAEKPVVRLSERGLPEKEIRYVLALLEGKSIKEIAYQNTISESTVRNSLSRSYKKLGVNDMAQLLQWAENNSVRP